MTEWPAWRVIAAGPASAVALRYLAVWLVTVQLRPPRGPGKQPETANLITQTDHRGGSGGGGRGRAPSPGDLRW